MAPLAPQRVGRLGHGAARPGLRHHVHCTRGRSARRRCRAGEGEEAAESPVSLDWRKFRAGLIAQEKRERQAGGAASPELAPSEASTSAGDEWAHTIAAPEPGCLLIAKSSAGDMGFFNNSVVLLLQHSARDGSQGLILGRRVQRNLPRTPLPAAVVSAAAYLGGPVALHRSYVVHGPPALGDSTEPLQGLFVCGWEETVARLAGRDGQPPPQHVSVFSGSCGWEAGQLDEEERTGAWWLVAASPQLVHGFLQDQRDEAFVKARLCELAGIEELASEEPGGA